MAVAALLLMSLGKRTTPTFIGAISLPALAVGTGFPEIIAPNLKFKNNFKFAW